MNMTEREVYKVVRQAIFDTPRCPDGVAGIACASCMAERITFKLVDTGIVEVDD